MIRQIVKKIILINFPFNFLKVGTTNLLCQRHKIDRVSLCRLQETFKLYFVVYLFFLNHISVFLTA